MVRFRHQQQTSKIPTIDLTPMLTVMMGVLGFFVVVSTLQADVSTGINVDLPQELSLNNSQDLRIQLNSEQQAIVEDVALSEEQVFARINLFLDQNSRDRIVLSAAPDVSYQVVIQWLLSLRDIGGDRVILNPNSTPIEPDVESSSDPD